MVCSSTRLAAASRRCVSGPSSRACRASSPAWVSPRSASQAFQSCSTSRAAVESSRPSDQSAGPAGSPGSTRGRGRRGVGWHEPTLATYIAQHAQHSSGEPPDPVVGARRHQPRRLAHHRRLDDRQRRDARRSSTTSASRRRRRSGCRRPTPSSSPRSCSCSAASPTGSAGGGCSLIGRRRSSRLSSVLAALAPTGEHADRRPSPAGRRRRDDAADLAVAAQRDVPRPRARHRLRASGARPSAGWPRLGSAARRLADDELLVALGVRDQHPARHHRHRRPVPARSPSRKEARPRRGIDVVGAAAVGHRASAARLRAHRGPDLRVVASRRRPRPSAAGRGRGRVSPVPVAFAVGRRWR